MSRKEEGSPEAGQYQIRFYTPNLEGTKWKSQSSNISQHQDVAFQIRAYGRR